jgi:hypothetical protein
MGVTFDATSFIKGTQRALSAIEKAGLQGINDVASEILRLGTYEVPHDKGILQGSGHVEPESNSTVVVGYNTVYAARLHEHPEYRFQKGRKGKYLEDPIKNNLSIFKGYIENAVKAAFT